jgi:predicted RNase H-like nuclease (RuvC/YqgF family)
MYTENFKRDRDTKAIVATNKEDINSHRNNLRHKNLLKKQIEKQDSEIRFLKSEVQEMKNMLYNLLKSK